MACLFCQLTFGSDVILVLNRRMKYLVSFAVASLVIIVPFGSWYYLQTGLNYRRALSKELVPKAQVSNLSSSTIFEGATTLLARPLVTLSLRDTLKVIFDQYQDGLTFQLVDLGYAGQLWDANHQSVPVDSLAEVIPADMQFALIDIDGQVRRYYDSSPSDVNKLIEHLAIIIPKPKRQDIKMRDGNDYDAKPSFMQKTDTK